MRCCSAEDHIHLQCNSAPCQLQVRGGVPHFAVQGGPPPPALPNFTCQLTIPALPPGRDANPTQTVFKAEARTKKAAEHAAAANALQYITSLAQAGSGRTPPPTQPMWPPQQHAQPMMWQQPPQQHLVPHM